MRSRARADRYVAFLRGVNVGRAKRVAMADLRRLVESLGAQDVRTLLNSGNVVFTMNRRPSDLADRIERAIGDRMGVSTRVTVLTGAELSAVVRTNPLAAVATDPSRALIMPLRDARTAAALRSLATEEWAPEALAVSGRTAYLWCANGIAAGRLWVAVDRVAKDGGTARNLATMTKLLALVQAEPAS